MAAVDFFTGFTYKWAQDGSVYNWDDAQYKQGWATIGSVPPSVEQFNRVHQVVDEKANWLYGQLKTAADAKGVDLSAGDLESLLDILGAATPDATEAVRGMVELATTAEAQTLTDDERVLTPKKLADALQSFVPGVGQTWQDLIGSRAANVTYTNTTGRVIGVAVSARDAGAGYAQLRVDGIRVAYIDAQGSTVSSPVSSQAFALVPPGATYDLQFTDANQQLTAWAELR